MVVVRSVADYSLNSSADKALLAFGRYYAPNEETKLVEKEATNNYDYKTEWFRRYSYCSTGIATFRGCHNAKGDRVLG